MIITSAYSATGITIILAEMVNKWLRVRGNIKCCKLLYMCYLCHCILFPC